MLEPEDGQAAPRAGRGRLRASHADREQVIDTLKDAFVQDRLTKDEFDTRVGQALASRTHADLAALTADLPAGPAAAQPPREPVRAQSGNAAGNATVKSGARVIAATTVLTAAVWAGALQSQAASQARASLVVTFTLVWLGIVLLVGAVMIESRRQRRSNGQLPPPPGDRDRGQASKREISADPPLRPDHRGRPHAAEASQRRMPRPSLLPEPRLNPS